MSTTFPPIAKGVQSMTNPLPNSDDEPVGTKKYVFTGLLQMGLNYGQMFLGRLSNFTIDDVLNMAFAGKASPASNIPDALDYKHSKVPVSMATEVNTDLKMMSGTLVVDDAAENHALKAIRISDEVDVAAVEAVLGYTFQNKALLEAALTHTSSKFKHLEFMGDKVISLVVTRKHLYEFDDSLTRLHSLNVDNEKLARGCVAHGLHRFLRHEVASFQRQVDDFAEENIAGYPLHSNGQARMPKLLADIIESLIGAVYIDSNDTEQVWQVFQRLADPLIGPETMAAIGKHPKTEFKKLNHQMRVKAKIDTREWTKSRTVKVVLAGETIGSATYHWSKNVARNRAMKSALDTIKKKIAKYLSKVLRKKRCRALVFSG